MWSAKTSVLSKAEVIIIKWTGFPTTHKASTYLMWRGAAFKAVWGLKALAYVWKKNMWLTQLLHNWQMRLNSYSIERQIRPLRRRFKPSFICLDITLAGVFSPSQPHTEGGCSDESSDWSALEERACSVVSWTTSWRGCDERSEEATGKSDRQSKILCGWVSDETTSFAKSSCFVLRTRLSLSLADFQALSERFLLSMRPSRKV